jgi:hypothetical protein
MLLQERLHFQTTENAENLHGTLLRNPQMKACLIGVKVFA